jgi:hypothetical protein
MALKEIFGLSSITVESIGDEWQPDDEAYRPAYLVTIRSPEWEYVTNDLLGGRGYQADEAEAMGSLLFFLLACVEVSVSANYDLFPEHVRLWADENENELCVLSLNYKLQR